MLQHTSTLITHPQRTTARVTAATSFGFALVQLDVTIINVALPRMSQALHTDVAGLSWLVDAYALAFAVLLLSGGSSADRFGAKRVYLAGMGAFALASLVCGLARDAPQLIAARMLQGVAAAAMLPSSLSFLNHVTGHDPALRARAIGIWTASGAITIAAGPIIGGMLLAWTGWRSIFLVNLPLCALGLWLTSLEPDPHRPAANSGNDWLGQLLAITSLAPLIAAVIELRSLGASHPLVASGFVVSAASLAGFLAVEARVAAPMLPLRLFRAPGLAASVFYGVAMNASYYGSIFVISLYLQRVHGYTALQCGLAFLPLTASFFVINLASGWLVARVGSRWPMVAGGVVGALGFALLSRLTAHTPYWAMVPAFTLIPLGMGTGIPAMTTRVLASVDRSEAGRAGGVLNAARQAGGAIGVAVCGALAGDAADHIVSGLHHAAFVAVALLLMAAAVAARFTR
jgi:DHA2 family methylenomycin A resistance protein-like MFS transporter